MKKATFVLPLTAIGLLCSAPLAGAAPDQPGVFLGAGIGYERIESEDFPDDTDNFEDERTAYKGFGGFRFNKVVAIEGQYIDFGDAVDGPLNVEATGWTAGLVLSLPINDFIQPYGKGGMLFWDVEASIDGFGGEASDDGNDPFYGVGLKLGLAENLDLRLEYERLEFDEVDVDLASANLQFNF